MQGKAWQAGQVHCPLCWPFDPRFVHDLIGYNFKTTKFQAALALCQLKEIEWIIKKRQENVYFLNENLKQYADILQLPPYSD
ncbi:unnamed protein product, partial [marine sediment metagenome]